MADNYLNGCFESISSCLDLRHPHLVSSGDKESRIRVDLDQLARVLPPWPGWEARILPQRLAVVPTEVVDRREPPFTVRG